MRRILIVDDHAPFRSAARQLLERGGFDVVGEAGDGDGALEAVRRLHPEVVLLDVQLPGDDGFATCERILDASGAAGTRAPVVVLTSGRPIGAFRRRLAPEPCSGVHRQDRPDGRGPGCPGRRHLTCAVDEPGHSRSVVSWRPSSSASPPRGPGAGVAPAIVAADLVVGWAYIGAGTAAWIGRPGSASGRLLVAVGVAWFAGTIWPPLEFLHRGPLVHVLATYPTGHLVIRPVTWRRWTRVAVVAIAYGLSVTRSVAPRREDCCSPPPSPGWRSTRSWAGRRRPDDHDRRPDSPPWRSGWSWPPGRSADSWARRCPARCSSTTCADGGRGRARARPAERAMGRRHDRTGRRRPRRSAIAGSVRDRLARASATLRSWSGSPWRMTRRRSSTNWVDASTVRPWRADGS